MLSTHHLSLTPLALPSWITACAGARVSGGRAQLQRGHPQGPVLPVSVVEAPLDLPIGKDPDAGKDWGQEKKGTTEDEMAGWHH